ncbi:MAG: biotin synthase BioB, partial [Campylobacter sp.]|nr:biotin synthase BioB [Campylobacter sp.]
NELLNSANEIRQKICGDKFNLCSIINVKSGKCAEDCKYCAQSAHYQSGCESYSMLNADEVLKMALENESSGVHRFSLVSSGKGLKFESKDMQKSCEIYDELKRKTKLHLCASFGISSKSTLLALKKSGVKTYHHNLETSRRFFPQICTTHSYDDRINTIKDAISVGLDVCSGGIFGLGEDLGDRIDMAFDLRALGVTSVPINILTPIKGTPLENMSSLSEAEILRSIAIYRFILPNAYLRFAGGRNNLKSSVKTAMHSGINSALTGNFLTTTGDTISSDKNMIKECGFNLPTQAF